MKAALLLATAAIASARVHVRPELSLGWRSASAEISSMVAHPDHEVSFLVSLRSQNMDVVYKFVESVSDPRSASYTDYMSREDIARLTRPSTKDIKTVMGWLVGSNMKFELVDSGASIRVSGRVEDAESLLNTKFEVLMKGKQHLVRATDYTLPYDVEDAIAAVFGLHGLPIPVTQPLVAPPGRPANVTPAVIAATYSVSGVKVSRSKTNRQAVAEFQGQTEKDADLAMFFKEYVKDAEKGDEEVYAFEGDKNKQNGQVEASLDIQYIMGVAPGIKTEFWLFMGGDFCADLVEWTNKLIADASGPNVHSISYGWQGNLTQVQCTDAKVKVIDDNYAKLAAAGVSIIFASGDSGSGYSPGSKCMSAGHVTNTKFEGTVKQSITVPEAQFCCEEAHGEPFSFEPIKSPHQPGNTCQGTDIGKKDEAYTGTKHQVFRVPKQEPSICCRLSGEIGLQFTFEPEEGSNYGNCTLFTKVTGTEHKKGAYAGKGANTRREGKCSIFSKVTKTVPATGATSMGSAKPSKPVLWPSWPASSPFITAVGATRFVGQKAGNEEMATDQFGSGGGFSKMFAQTPNAKYQVEAVAHYVNNPPKDPKYPPAGSFPPHGRATPDISALGEGYQVYVNGRLEAVGGTSASTPAFAGLVSLMNEARAQAGKKPLGFLNPFIYQNADCFTDITKGTNAIGRGNGPIAYGFAAAPGWDPATGLGTPKFDKLLAAALKA